MKALSFRQPWAELILQGRKTIDLRTWPTNFRGRMAVHASLAVEEEVCRLYDLDPGALARGALVGTVEVGAMVPLDESSWEALRDQHLKPGPFPGDLLGWQLAGAERLPQPIPLRGRLGLFNVPDGVMSGEIPVPATPRASVARYQAGPAPAYDPARPFELHVVPQAERDYALALYQWPVAAAKPAESTPAAPRRLAELGGARLRAVADHVLDALRRAGYRVTDLSRERRAPFRLDEESGLRLGLLFLTVRPLARMERVQLISAALRAMPSEEAYYWFSKCTASAGGSNAQRALRVLLAGE